MAYTISQADHHFKDFMRTWFASLLKGPEAVVANYAEGSTLLPTVSNVARTTLKDAQNTDRSVFEYFDKHFCPLKPKGVLTATEILHAGQEGALVARGAYTFTVEKDGKQQEVKARYIYALNSKGEIAHHHSLKESHINPDKGVARFLETHNLNDTTTVSAEGLRITEHHVHDLGDGAKIHSGNLRDAAGRLTRFTVFSDGKHPRQTLLCSHDPESEVPAPKQAHKSPSRPHGEPLKAARLSFDKK